jgi:RNA chaperone Hfq
VEKTISVFLINGVRLTGTIESFDAFTVLLKDTTEPERGRQLGYRKLAATIVPTREGESSYGGDGWS